MQLKRTLGLVICGALALVTLPVERLPPSWQPRYYDIFGEPAYREAPGNKPVVIEPLDADTVCPPEYTSWREASTIEGVAVAASADCLPDNPWEVAAAVRGTNNVSMDTLMKTLFAVDAVEKSDDLDGDGDPDRIHIRLEVMELNGKSPDGPGVVPRFEIGPGITPGFWVFAPKSRGMTTLDFESVDANRLVRLPAPVIRVEQGDEVRITLENTHYLPHTIHFHGLDHPFRTPEGEGNDGVPLFSEHPVMPGAARTYRFKPRHPGTTFYHCHVQPHAHILMGLQGLLVVEENRPANWVQTFNIGAARVRAPSVAVREHYDREYDLHYLEIDRDLNDRIQQFTDPRLVSRAVHRDYNVTQRQPEYFVLNGRSFPYTLRESLVVMAPGESARLRILNGGSEGLSLHFHGHKPTLTHVDGVALTEAQRVQRDVFWISGAQRADVTLKATDDGLNAYGPGAWLLHDHREQATTSNGIGPGGDVSLVVYEDFVAGSGLPQTVGGMQDLAPFFSPDYYAGRIPVFAGMQGHALLDPADPGAGSLLRRLVFVVSSVTFIALLLLVPLGAVSGRGTRP